MSENLAAARSESDQEAARVEKRSSRRYSSEPQTTISLLVRPTFLSLNARVRDASTTGLGLILDRRLEKGTILHVQLPGQRHRRLSSALLSACVVHATPQADGTWLLGCKLSALLKEDELKTLLEFGRTQTQYA